MSVTPVGSAKFDAATSTVSFPITRRLRSHPLRPRLQARVHRRHRAHEASGLKFSGGGKSIEVTDFVVDLGNSTLTASASGKSGIPLGVVHLVASAG